MTRANFLEAKNVFLQPPLWPNEKKETWLKLVEIRRSEMSLTLQLVLPKFAAWLILRLF